MIAGASAPLDLAGAAALDRAAQAEGTMANALLISAGDVIEVQLTSETVVIQGSEGRRPQAQPGHILNRMRLFVRELDGQEQKYDFDDTELGVRETQRVAIVRARVRKMRDPVNLMLFNLSTGESDAFETGLAAHLAHRPFFGPLWKALVLSFGVAVVFWFVSNFITRQGGGGLMSVFLAGMFAFLTYPLFWWLSAAWDRLTERFRYRAARKRFINEMNARVRAYAPAPAAEPAAAPAAAAAPAPAPAAPAPTAAPAAPAAAPAPQPGPAAPAPEAPPAAEPGGA
jgi:hypothetical protein